MLRGSDVLAERSEYLQKGQAERLLGLCNDLLDEAGVPLQDLTALGVGIGPGNFTGIRISVAAARGLALGLNIPAVGVTTFEALRFGASGACICAVDARRDQIYVQEFDATGAGSDPVLKGIDFENHRLLPFIGHGGSAPAYATAVAIGQIAAQRFHSDPARPAPLYLRPADAAPARDAPPKILT